VPSAPQTNRRSLLLGAAGLAGLAIASVPLAAPGIGLVPGAVDGGPGWLRGVYGGGLGVGGGAYYALMWLAFVSYLAVLAGARALGSRVVWAAIAIAVIAFTLSPPLLSADVFSYISYGRLGAVHGLNPYQVAPAAVPADPAFAHVGWRDTVSAYGPVFTLITYPIALLGVPAALWSLKAGAGAAVIALAAITARLAARRGADPAMAAAFVALNPLVLVHVVGGAHNDALMMLVVMVAATAVAGARERTAGAGMVAAAAVKVSAAFAAPFALFAASRRPRLLGGALLAAIAVGAASVIAFGSHALDAVGLVGENQALTSHYSLPSTLARVVGVGTDPVRVAALAAFSALVAWLLYRCWRGADPWWAAAWAALGLLLATGWLLPWYLIWALPLAAIARDRTLGACVLALTAFQLVNRIPL
jgi:alpha-1,6-mannosyltransferase